MMDNKKVKQNILKTYKRGIYSNLILYFRSNLTNELHNKVNNGLNKALHNGLPIKLQTYLHND